jgi:endonuclease/exonuclease/phosphatase family metal-dependent hydrolase
MALRVVTWNLQWRERPDWRARLPAIAATLRALSPDLVALQEVWITGQTSSASLLAQELGLHPAVAAPSLPPPPDPPERPDMEGVEVGVAVLSRFPILATERTAFASHHRDETVALAVTVGHPLGPLHLVATCLDWEPREGSRRPDQARVLAGLALDPARDGDLPVLLAGDFNAPPDSPELRLLTDRLVDTWVAGGGADGPEGHTLSSANPLAPRAAWQIDQRIDFVLARPGRPERPVTVERAFLAGEPIDGVHPSDHWAGVVDLSLSGGYSAPPEG